MRTRYQKWPIVTGLATIVSAMCLLVATPSTQSEESTRKPAKEDSKAFFRPKPHEAKFTTSVQPAEAKPGDIVTYSVTAKLGTGWHIYKAETGEDPTDRPAPTKFDFFDTAGLEPKGEWKASKPVQSKPEPGFNNAIVEFYEDEVTWSVELKIPSGTGPGKKTLRNQIRFQICDPRTCKNPTRLTLPDAEVTVVAGAAKSAASSTRSEEPTRKPAAKDTPAILRPKPTEAQFTTSVQPAEAKPGDTVTYSVTAKLGSGWHIYKAEIGEDPTDRPLPTKFDFFDTAGLEPKGEWKASKPVTSKPEPGFNNAIVDFYEDDVTWSIQLKIPSGTEPGKKNLRNQIRFQVCDPKSCKQAKLTLSGAELTVLAADAKSTASSTSPSAKSAGAPAAPEAAKPAVNEPAAASTRESNPATGTRADEVQAKSSPVAPTSGESEASSASAGAPASAFVNDAAKKAQQGIIPFLLFSAAGGLLALVMPCVWPMVPITVNFFVKQGQANGGRSTFGLAVAYCLAIIGVFTTVGVLFSFFFSASSLQRLANNPWLNTAVAALFVAFGLSLLGLFEIRLPNFLLNASARGESRGGMIGVMFMALTLTITSFTCTFPVVGGLLVMAGGGEFFYPIIGLATFATVLALPFFLLALAPGLLAKMPKSGDWMNAVKVVGGLVELGAAFKFVNTAEIGFGATPSDAWFDAQVVLTIWVILAAVCGVYLLGLFRTDHDHDAVKVGPGRLLFGSAFLVLALFLAPALFGRPPQSRVWYELVGLFPPDIGELNVSASLIPGTPQQHGRDATSDDPKQAEREQTSLHGVVWGWSYDAAMEKAQSEKRPILIDFTGVNCPNCRKMEQFVLPRPEVVKLLGEFVTVQLYTDFVPLKPIKQSQREELAVENAKRLYDLTNDTANPSYVALSPEGKVLARLGGATPPSEFVGFLNEALTNFRSAVKLARD